MYAPFTIKASNKLNNLVNPEFDIAIPVHIQESYNSFKLNV